MDMKEKVLNELQTLCGTVGLDSQKVSAELSEFIGLDEVIDYYIARGSLPSFPNTLVDVIVLTEKSLLDCEVRKKGRLFYVLPLKGIVQIAETFTGKNDEFLSLQFRIAGFGGGLATEAKLSESANLHRFSMAVKRKIG